MQLVKDLLAELPGGVGASFTVVCADLDTASLASERLLNPVSVIDPSESGVTKGPLLIVNPRADQVGLLAARAWIFTANRPILVVGCVCGYLTGPKWRNIQLHSWYSVPRYHGMSSFSFPLPRCAAWNPPSYVLMAGFVQLWSHFKAQSFKSPIAPNSFASTSSQGVRAKFNDNRLIVSSKSSCGFWLQSDQCTAKSTVQREAAHQYSDDQCQTLGGRIPQI